MKTRFNSSPVRRAILYSLGLVIGLRLFTGLVLLVVGLLMPTTFQPGDPTIAANLRMMEGQSFLSKYFLAPWYRWDTLHFVSIADQGYANKIETVWPPLYPVITAAVAKVFQPTLLAGLLVSTLALILALALLYVVVQDYWDEDTARRTLVYLAFFPTAFFLVAAYTESLFLVFSLGCLYAYKKSKWAAAAALGVAAVLTRVQGIVLVAPMAWEVLNDLFRRRYQSTGQFLRQAVPVAAIILGWLGYFLFAHYALGADWPWQIQSAVWRQQLTWPWSGIWGNFTSLTFNPIETNYPTLYRLLDLLLPCAAIVLLVLAWKKIPALFRVYAACQLLVILTKVNNNLLVAAGRYLLVVFPVMVAAALTLNTTARRIWIIFAIGCQAYFLILFYWWIWAA